MILLPPVFSLNDHEFLLKFNIPCLIVLCESTSGIVHINMSVTKLFDNYYSECINDKTIQDQIIRRTKPAINCHSPALYVFTCCFLIQTTYAIHTEKTVKSVT